MWIVKECEDCGQQAVIQRHLVLRKKNKKNFKKTKRFLKKIFKIIIFKRIFNNFRFARI